MMMMIMIAASTTFESFLGAYNRSYTDASEYAYRESIFETNLQLIDAHNVEVDSHGFQLSVNAWTDHTGLERIGGGAKPVQGDADESEEVATVAH